MRSNQALYATTIDSDLVMSLTVYNGGSAYLPSNVVATESGTSMILQGTVYGLSNLTIQDSSLVWGGWVLNSDGEPGLYSLVSIGSTMSLTNSINISFFNVTSTPITVVYTLHLFYSLLNLVQQLTIICYLGN